jgi:hypothetical protein
MVYSLHLEIRICASPSLRNRIFFLLKTVLFNLFLFLFSFSIKSMVKTQLQYQHQEAAYLNYDLCKQNCKNCNLKWIIKLFSPLSLDFKYSFVLTL